MEEVKLVSSTKELLTIALSGEIDFGKAEGFYDSVMESYLAQPANIRFDCSALAFIDSTTLGTFVKIFKKMKADGYAMELIGLQAKIKKLFVICALDSIIKIA